MQKEEQMLEKRLLELSRLAYNRDIVTYSDFLNLNELNILHMLPKDTLYTGYVTFGGYGPAERQMAAFLPDALSLRGKSVSASEALQEEAVLKELFSKELCVLKLSPLNVRYAEDLTHRDYLGAMLNLGIDRGKTGDILVSGKEALVFVKPQMKAFLMDGLTRVRHTSVMVTEESLQDFQYEPKYEELKGTVASVRLDSLLALAFSSSRSRLTGLIEGAKVYVNGKLVTSNGYQVKEKDIISVRGMGKFQFRESLHVTRKNRIYVSLYKYI